MLVTPLVSQFGGHRFSQISQTPARKTSVALRTNSCISQTSTIELRANKVNDTFAFKPAPVDENDSDTPITYPRGSVDSGFDNTTHNKVQKDDTRKRNPLYTPCDTSPRGYVYLTRFHPSEWVWKKNLVSQHRVSMARCASYDMVDIRLTPLFSPMYLQCGRYPGLIWRVAPRMTSVVKLLWHRPTWIYAFESFRGHFGVLLVKGNHITW